MMMERYWSAVQQLAVSPEATVAPTIDVLRRSRPVMALASAPSIPVPIITQPKSIALSTSITVGIIPAMPPVEMSASISGLPVAGA